MRRLWRNRAFRGAAATAVCIAAGIVSAMCFVIAPEGYVGMSASPAAGSDYLWTALALLFAWLFLRVYRRGGLRLRAPQALFALLFGVLNAFCGVLFAYDTWSGLASPGALAATLLKSVGQALPMAAALTWADGALRGGSAKGREHAGVAVPGLLGRLWRWAARHDVPACMLLLIACWSPYLIAFFPGTVCWDVGEMVAQTYSLRQMNTWHPVFLTWMAGFLVRLGRWAFHSDNAGAAMYMLLQTAALSYALARAVRFLRQCGMSRAVRAAAAAFFALTPLWGGYAQFISKDTLYTAALLLFTLSVLRLLRAREGHMQTPVKRECAELFVWGLLTCLMRTNGLYVVLPTAAVAVWLMARGRDRLWVGGALAGMLACALGFSNVLLPALGITDATSSGIYSVCFQQSARVLRDHAASVTPEEYAAIDSVLDAPNLPELYEPWISDPVKYTFKQYGQGAEAERAALARYRETWLSMFKKYPLTYAEAFFAGNLSYYTFAPKLEGETYNYQAGNRLVFETYDVGEDARFLHTTQPAALAGARTLLAAFARGWRRIPVLALLYVCPVYTWLLVGAGLSVARQRRWRLLAGYLPALLTLGVCMLGPVNDYFRYFLPIVAMTAPLLAASKRPEAA